jgi:cytochrome c-type biogenesis protein CcmF
LNLGKLSVGPPYFNLVFAPLMVPLLFILVPGTVARWREARLSELVIELRWVGLLALLMGGVAPLAYGPWSAGTALGWTLGAWVALGTVWQVVQRLRKPGRIPASFWGMHLAHLGMAVLVVGVTGVKSFEVERDVRMGLGDEVSIAPYTFRLVGMSNVQGPNYRAVRAQVQVLRHGQPLEVLWPEKRNYVSSAMPMTEAAIDSGFMRDLYVSLGDRLEGDRAEWSMRVYYKPFVPWLWGGVLLMVVGGVAAALDRRYRKTRVVDDLTEGACVARAG